MQLKVLDFIAMFLTPLNFDVTSDKVFSDTAQGFSSWQSRMSQSLVALMVTN